MSLNPKESSGYEEGLISPRIPQELPSPYMPPPEIGKPTILGPPEPSKAQIPVGHMISRGFSEGMREDELDWACWSAEDVAGWIDLLLGEGAGDAFRQHQVDGPTLLMLQDDDLRSILGISNALHRQKILGHVKVFQLKLARLGQMAKNSPVPRQPLPSSVLDDSSIGRGSSRMLGSQEFTNGHFDYAPSSRKQIGRSTSAGPRIERDHSGASSLHGGFSRSTEASFDSRPESSCGLHGFNRFSRYLNPSRSSTAGLTSCFGLDSPSFSVQGSWNRSPRRLGQDTCAPGPCTYNVVSNLEALRSNQPRTTIGQSPRRTAEYFVPTQSTRGGGKFLEADARRTKIKGGVIGRGPRWARENGRIPGPGAYRPREGFLSTFR